MFPTIEEVKAANHEQICRWYRFLPSTLDKDDAEVMDEMHNRYEALGGMTPEISKKIGWEE